MEKGRRTKETILTHAHELFAKKGFKAVTMQDLCDAANLSRGGLYRHYQSTQQIMAELLSRLAEHQDDEIQWQIQAHVPARRICDALLDRYLKEMLDSEHSLSLAIYEYNSLYHDPIMAHFYTQAHQRWCTLLAYGISQKEFHPVDTEAVADCLLFAYQGARMWSTMIPLQQQAQHIIEHIRKELYI